MNTKSRITFLMLALLLTLTAGVTQAQGPGEPQYSSAVEIMGGPPLTDAFTYQGYFQENDQPANGYYDFRFYIWDAQTLGNLISTCQVFDNQLVEDGLFAFSLMPGDPMYEVFNGERRWIEVRVRPHGTTTWTTLPRQPIAATPYAWSLRPGAVITGTIPDQSTLFVGNAYDAGTIGSAITAENHADTSPSIYARHLGTGHALYGWTESGYPTVEGRNAGGGTGVVGASDTGVGVYGSSQGGVFDKSYGGSFYSENYRALRASSDTGSLVGYFVNRGGSAQPGLYIDGTLSVTGSKSGYVVDVVQNAGPDPLETGDVVVIVGVAEPVLGEIPVMQVRKAAESASTAVTGVVDQPFSAGESEAADSIPHPSGEMALAATNTAIQVGEYASVVTLGAFKAIHVDASYGAIHPGDLLVSSSTPGYAMRADSPAPGTIIGKALELWETGQGTIAVMLSLQ